MTTRLNPYIVFTGQAREAMTFYQSVFGGDLQLMAFGDLAPSGDAAADTLIMHGQLMTPSGYVLMGADLPAGMEHTPGASVTVCLNGDADGEAELTDYWNKLTDGATIGMELGKQMWGDIYGDLVDKFGVHWSVDIAVTD